jgi:hypothetical protein
MRTLFGIFVATVAVTTASAQSGAPLPQPGNVSLPLDEYNRLKEHWPLTRRRRRKSRPWRSSFRARIASFASLVYPGRPKP